MREFDTGIYGLWYGHNYGSIITYYALYKTLESNGHSCAMIDNPLNTEQESSGLRRSHPLKFAREHYSIAPHFALDKMTELNDLFDTFVLGSDQMWNYNLSRSYQQTYFLDFANSEKRKYSYATSFGNGSYEAPAEYTEQVQQNLARFNGISVRDDFSKRILQDTFHVKSDVVLDPVFLCDRTHYEALINECDNFIDADQFIFAYILDPNSFIGDSLSRIAEELNIRIYVCFDEGGDKERCKKTLRARSEKVICLDGPTIQEWLYMIKNADLILTDSYHGACFSMIFHKSFVVKKNNRRGGMRFEHILNAFGLIENMITDPSSLYTKAMSVERTANYQLENEFMRFSRQWIRNI